MFYDMGTARYGVIQLELIKEAVWIAMSSSKGFTDNSLYAIIQSEFKRIIFRCTILSIIDIIGLYWGRG